MCLLSYGRCLNHPSTWAATHNVCLRTSMRCPIITRQHSGSTVGMSMNTVMGMSMGMDMDICTCMSMGMSMDTGMATMVCRLVLDHTCKQAAHKVPWPPHTTVTHLKANGEGMQRERLTCRHTLTCRSRACDWQAPHQPLSRRRFNEARAWRSGMAVGTERGSWLVRQ